ncbi:hypothetical protein [Bifidobacterium myosotis]|uniref:Uncharacterized protein n=1 Tax=Bifidobacterium myosotis TaxID=1630166 RepID=A0A5M9ZFP6_9BIFI|nr:hypothetical protein [Bifidobacterium myosotis]KAA8825107.1 hypothetical protein EMO91_12830 [Bifidobacterium myosotis]
MTEPDIIDEYRTLAGREGVDRARTTLILPLLNAWYDALDGARLPARTARAIAAFAALDGGLRDALAIAAAYPADRRNAITTFITHAGDARARSAMAALAAGLHLNPFAIPYPTRVKRARTLLARVGGPAAAAADAWLAWAAAMPDAADAAHAALDADPGSPLAAAVLADAERGVGPAWAADAA